MAKGARGYARFAEQMAVFGTAFLSNGGNCNGEGVPQELGNSAAARPGTSLARVPDLG